MQISSRTIVSVVGTVMMVLATVVLAAWSQPQPVPQNSAVVSVLR
ncbi:MULTISPECIES: archaellin/type IV pilin N-terminal domain-containing protein [Saccharopolyspora]|nr:MULTISPECIES: archaellin/type IV pilin N-terminal domain-containing protein [Saccharopolyspora]